MRLYSTVLLVSIGLMLHTYSWAQTTNTYQISFDNATHHEAQIKATFPNLENKVLELTMSRASPGRYAIHDFAKNVYGVRATDSQGNLLQVTRSNPHQWHVAGHDGTVNVEYTLYANRGDGTYTQIDETHAHLNMPATFMFAPRLASRPIDVMFDVREDLHWKVATQLKHIGGNVFRAPDLDYFMDSPTEISDYKLREFTETSNGNTYTIRFVLHHDGEDTDLDTYTERVKRIVAQEKAVYGELPDYEYGTYTFLACYMPNVSGDGMEHRNSTILTSTRSLAAGGLDANLGTVSHEFFHAWNVERIRPLSLEPFNFTEANMSGELWFAEGFTSYYTRLMLCRAGLITPKEYVDGLAGALNYVWNSPALAYFNPIEMSYQAPFVDAATSVDPVNWPNTFVSYYSYGSVLGLALDLSLRNLDKGLTLDGFMKLMWQEFGKPGVPYTVKDIESTLASYAGEAFAGEFFDHFIYDSKMPDYSSLLSTVGVTFKKANDQMAYLGAKIVYKDGIGEVTTNPLQGSPLYLAGVENGDNIEKIGEIDLHNVSDISDVIKSVKIDGSMPLIYTRNGIKKETTIQFLADPAYQTTLMEEGEQKPGKAQLANRQSWLGGK